jgi:hypothetical protein
MNQTLRFFRVQAVFFCVAVSLIPQFSFTARSSAATSAVNLTSPANGSTVSGSATISAAVSSAVLRVNFYIDGAYLTSGPPYILDWNSTKVTNSRHRISVTAYGADNAVLGSSSVTINVMNGWMANHIYAAGTVLHPSFNNPGGYLFQAAGVCTSGFSQPIWPQMLRFTVIDNTCAWTNVRTP